MSISKRPDGQYRARWREADGKQRAKHFARKIDAEQFLATVRVDTAKGAYISPDAGHETVGAYAVTWAQGQPWRDSSRDRMNHVIRTQLVPRFGSVKVRSLRTSTVQAWIGAMSSDGLAPSTIQSYFQVLVAVMKSAKRDRLIAESPCDGIRLPRSETTTSALVPLTTEQVHELAAAVPGHYRGLILASAGLGLRQGEACGLTIDRVDFMRRKVRIDRQLISPNAGAVRFGPPKTASSNRVLTLSTFVSEVLAEHVATYGTGADGLLFRSTTGSPLRRSTWQAAFANAAKKVGVEASTHDLRHYCASNLIAAGCSVTAVQHFLGHKNASETLDTYSHLWPDNEDKIRAAIDFGMRAASMDGAPILRAEHLG